MTAWTEERRARQREMMLRNKPWEKSTGPKTPGGKARSAKNSFKNGNYAQSWDYCRLALKLNKQFVKTVLSFTEAHYQEMNLLRAKNKLENELLKNPAKSIMNTPPPGQNDQTNY